MKKVLSGFLVVVAASLFAHMAQFRFPITESPEDPSVIIGAVLPLSGSGAVFGEDMRNAIELALEEEATNGVHMRAVYADSQAIAKEGVAAYAQLNATHDVDVIVTAFSRVAIPLVDLAHEHKQPIITTLVAAKDLPVKSPYAFRFYSPPEDFANAHFDTRIQKERYGSIGVLYIHDEYGAAIVEAIEQRAAKEGIPLVAAEHFEPNATDMRTGLTKIKAANPAALLIVPSSPPEAISIVRQLRELDLSMDVFEASVHLSAEMNRTELGDMAHGIYTITYPFSVQETEAAREFREKYETRFQETPNFIAPFAYDIVRMIARASAGKNMSREELTQAVQSLGIFDSVNGTVRIQDTGEITPPIRAVRIEHGDLVPIH